MITITPNAENELRKLLANRAKSPASGLRLSVHRGGCAGWQYEMQVADPETGDVIIDLENARIIVAADSQQQLNGCEIDYADDLTDAGFKILNPQAVRSCGCGTSFETSNDTAQSTGTPDDETCSTR